MDDRRRRRRPAGIVFELDSAADTGGQPFVCGRLQGGGRAGVAGTKMRSPIETFEVSMADAHAELAAAAPPAHDEE